MLKMPDPALVSRAFCLSLKHAVRAILIGGAWLWCGVCSSALAQEYRFDVLNTDNGLPQNSVYSILQTRDGYLWFTTLDGLVRYNGAQFTVFNKANTPGIKTNRFRCLYEDTDGTLWIGTDDGGVTRYRGGQFKTYSTEEGLPHNLVDLIRRTPDGDLLALTATGLARLRGEKFEVISNGIQSIDASPGIVGPSGATWYRFGGELRRVKDGQTTTYRVPVVTQGLYDLGFLYEDRQGRLWIGGLEPGELWMLKDEVLTRYGLSDGILSAPSVILYEDQSGTMWFGGSGGLMRLKDGRFTTYTTAQGLSSNHIQCIFEDREGTMWIGTRDNGLMRMTRRVVTTLSEKDGLRGKIFYPIIEDRTGAIWVGNVGINRIKDGRVTFYPLNHLLQYVIPRQSVARYDALISALHEDRQGRLWISHSGGVYRYEREQFIDDPQMGKPGVSYAIYQDTGGAFWFGYNEALKRYQDGEVKTFGKADGLDGFVQPIYEDRRGRIWIGSYGGLAQYVDGRLVLLTEKDGLSSNRVRALYEDSDGVLWIGTYDGGLNRFKDGRFTRYTMKEGMFSNGVFAILEDAHGNFWMSSNQGIYRVRKQQLNDFAEGKISRIDSVAYGKADGMLNTECNGARQPAAIKTRDGRLWFPTFDGVAVVNPEAVTFNAVPPPIVIEKVILDRAEVDYHLPLEIRPGQGNLEIRYAGLSFIKPESMQFKYKLEGLDPDWVEVGNRRTAYYPHLSPGSYTFRVMAANSDGVWNESGAQLKVTVIPPFYRTWWFILLAGLSVAGLAVMFYQMRVNQLRRAHAQQEAFSRRLIESQESERKRIATELHDSLGQHLLVIKNRAVLGDQLIHEPSQVKEQLDEINASATEAIKEARAIAYNLRPVNLDRLGLAAMLEEMIEQVARSSGIQFSADIEPLDGLLTKEGEINCYRIIQESLNNIVRHAQATKAYVEIWRKDGELRATVRDNGCGFDAEALLKKDGTLRSSSLGLTSIGERVRLLGGTLTFDSAPGQGTTLNFRIPIQVQNEVRGDNNHGKEG